MEGKVVIEHALYVQAMANYGRFYPRRHGMFRAFIGADKPNDIAWENIGSGMISVPAASVHKIRLLAGPHYHAVLKAHEAQGKG